MYFEDLSPYTYGIPPDAPSWINFGKLADAVNVGWLADGYNFEKGSSPKKFLSRLRKLTKSPENVMWGVHDCDICDSARCGASGNGEIHVTGADGITYVAPVLLVHYIDARSYRPPQPFIDAVLEDVR